MWRASEHAAAAAAAAAVDSVELRDNLYARIRDWLTGRPQRALLNGYPTECLPVTSEAPQPTMGYSYLIYNY